MSFRYEIRLSGEGGQGLVLAGRILAEAASIYDEKHATQSQSYGPEAQGGASNSEVIISDEAIESPNAGKLDLLVAFTQESCNKYAKDLKESGVLLVDSTMVTHVPEGKYRTFRVPITEVARIQLGKAVAANIVALGIIAKLANAVSIDALESAVMARVPEGTEDLNLKAFRIGMDLAARFEPLEA